MIIYLDLIFFINFFYDFLLLLTVCAVLKRNAKLYRHIISAIIGALSIFLLFININRLILFLLKVIVSIIMCLVSFKYISFKYTLNNLLYLYMTSVILAGFLYYLNTEFSLKNEGIIFFYDGLSVNYILLIIISPIILYLYYRSSKKIKVTYNLYHKIIIAFDDYLVSCLALFDSGNNLKDSLTGKAIIILDAKYFGKIAKIRNPMYVPYYSASGSSVMQCYKPSYILLNGKKIYNYLVGKSAVKFKDGVDCILNVKLMEDNYV